MRLIGYVTSRVLKPTSPTDFTILFHQSNIYIIFLKNTERYSSSNDCQKYFVRTGCVGVTCARFISSAHPRASIRTTPAPVVRQVPEALSRASSNYKIEWQVVCGYK